MKITIAHLYYDLLNLYGESGNLKALTQGLEHQGVEVCVKFLTVTDTIDFADVNFIYVGAGTEQNQKIALRHMMKYKEEFEKAWKENVFFLATGNAIELFGKAILDGHKKRWNALHFFSYTAKEEPFRIVDEALMKTDLISDYILGFQNQNSVIKDLKHPFLEVVKGTGSYPGSKGEGIHEGHFYGTYLIGPFLVRNPSFLEYLVKQVIWFYDPTYEIRPFSLVLETLAYDTFLKHYYKEYLTKQS